MNKQIALQKIVQFFLIRIVIGIVIIAGLVVFAEWAGKLLLEKIPLNDSLKNAAIAISDSAMALSGYIFLFRHYEKRSIKELSPSAFGKYAFIGFAAGSILQSLFILVLYITGNYSVIKVNPVSYLLPSFVTAFTAGFVGEIIIRGIIFRIAEEKLGTVVAVVILVMLFALFHLNVEGATPLSVFSTAMQAGLLLSAAYILTRSLWVTIFLHFAWDFTEPGIFGAINPGNSIHQSLFSAKISGSVFLTGGQFGPQNSIQALIICLVAGILMLWLAKQKNNFIKPYWKK